MTHKDREVNHKYVHQKLCDLQISSGGSTVKIHTDDLALYHYETCPYCEKVRETVDRIDLDLELRNIRKNSDYREELKRGGGQTQVPCLRIDHGNGTDWMYESEDIVQFLTETFGHS